MGAVPPNKSDALVVVGGIRVMGSLVFGIDMDGVGSMGDDVP
jgi:hypothetical protein